MSDDAWRAWAEPLSTGVALVDADLCLVWINPALAEWLAVGPRSVVGRPLTALIAIPSLQAQAARMVGEGGSVQWRELALADRDMRVDVAMQPWSGGGWLLEVHALGEPPPTTSALSTTLRGFAHEIKNPLAGLRGAAQLLARRAVEPDQKALASMIIAEADRLAALAGRLLQPTAPRMVATNIHAVIERVERLLASEPAPLRWIADFDPSLPDVPGAPDRLLQLLLNLAGNARQAGARTVCVRTRVEYGARVGDRCVRSALRLDLSDDGEGVAPALADRLFEPLVSGRPEGTGLGLALAREIAHEHGGELRLSRLQPATFTLLLPLDRIDVPDVAAHGTEKTR